MHLGADGPADVVAAVQQVLAVLVAALFCYVLGQVLNLACNWYRKRSNMKIMAQTATQLTVEEEPEEECRGSPPASTAMRSIALLLVVLISEWPQFPPFNESPLLKATLLSWHWSVWAFVVAPLWLSLAVPAVREVVMIRTSLHWLPVKGSDGTGRAGCRACSSLTALALGMPLVAWVHVTFILRIGRCQTWPNGRLRLCSDWCGGPLHGPRAFCYSAPPIAPDPRSPKERAEQSISFFRQNVVIGQAPPVHAVALSNASVRIIVGEGPECSLDFPMLDPGRSTVVLSFGPPYGVEDKFLVAPRQRRHWSALPLAMPHDCATTRDAPRIATQAAVMNAVQRALLGIGYRVAAWGCSVNSKTAFWAAATTPMPYAHVTLDSGGTFGPGSARTVGPCGETFESAWRRHPSWYAPNASQAPPPAEWPSDSVDLMLAACHHTPYDFSVGDNDLWANPAGIKETMRLAHEAGCPHDNVRLVVGNGGAHCGYFVESNVESNRMSSR